MLAGTEPYGSAADKSLQPPLPELETFPAGSSKPITTLGGSGPSEAIWADLARMQDQTCAQVPGSHREPSSVIWTVPGKRGFSYLAGMAVNREREVGILDRLDTIVRYSLGDPA